MTKLNIKLKQIGNGLILLRLKVNYIFYIKNLTVKEEEIKKGNKMLLNKLLKIHRENSLKKFRPQVFTPDIISPI